jgi:photoactive yellow protein
MRILIVEDHAELAQALTEVLQANGHQVISTQSGLDAVLLAEQGSFELILLNIETRRLSGLGAQQAIRDFTRIPVIAMSASTAGWRKDALRAGAVACLSKPFEMDALLALIHDVESGIYATSKSGFVGNVRQLSRADLERLRSMPPEELDALPFGAIVLDRQRRIVAYNAYESQASGRRAASLIGRSFSEIAPCSLVREFGAALNRGFEERELDTVLRFVFPFHGAWTVVSVRFYFDDRWDRMWLFVSLRNGDASEDVARWAEPLEALSTA